jgi:hypothetical protein
MCSMATAGGAWRARGPVNCVKRGNEANLPQLDERM